MKKLLAALALIAALAVPARADVYNISQDVTSHPYAYFSATEGTVGTLTATSVSSDYFYAADGTGSLPSFTFASAPTYGFYYASGLVRLTIGGSLKHYWGSTNYTINSSVAAVIYSDTTMGRDYEPYAISIRNDTNPGVFRVYGTFTDYSNYERGYLQATTTGLVLGHEAAGTGSAKSVRIASGGTTAALFSQTETTMVDETSTAVLNITVPDDSVCGVTFAYTALAADATDALGHMGIVSALCWEDPDAVGSYDCAVSLETEHTGGTGGTLVDTWGYTAGATSSIECSFDQETADLNSSLKLNVLQNSGCVLAIP
jgi:hypothetical protein